MEANNYIKVISIGSTAEFFPFNDYDTASAVKADVASRAHVDYLHKELGAASRVYVRRAIYRPCPKVGWMKIVGAF